MYLYKFQNVFVHNSKYMCLKFKSLVQKVFAKHCNPDDKETGGAQRYLSKNHNVSVQISKFIFKFFKRYFYKFQNVFAQTSKGICPNFKMYLSKFRNVFAKHRYPNDKETGGTRRPPLLALSPFANCWIFHELLCFALNQHLFIIDDGDDDFNDRKRFPPKRYPPKIYPPKMCLPKLNLAQLAALIKCTLSIFTLENCTLPNCL